MSKKNSNVILKSCFRDYRDLSKVYTNFKNKLKKFKIQNCVVAVSGGPDSLALSALAKAYSYEKKIKIKYVLIDHKIRVESSKEANQVKNLLKKNKITIHILVNKRKVVKNIQGQARKIRYEMLTKFCTKNKITTLLTAHNLEDQVETFFIRLSRGSGLTGLSSMELFSPLERNVKLLRPLLEIKKKVLVKISKVVFGKYIKDPSNKKNRYLRTKIRNLKKPLTKSGISYDQIIKSINNLASSKLTLDEYFKKTLRETLHIHKGIVLIDLKKFENLPNEIKIKIINASIKRLQKNYYDPRSKKVQNLIKNINSKNFNKATLGGCLFFQRKDELCVKKEEK